MTSVLFVLNSAGGGAAVSAVFADLLAWRTVRQAGGDEAAPERDRDRSVARNQFSATSSRHSRVYAPRHLPNVISPKTVWQSDAELHESPHHPGPGHRALPERHERNHRDARDGERDQ